MPYVTADYWVDDYAEEEGGSTNSHLITLGLGAAFLITLGMTSGIVPSGVPPSAICLSDAAQAIALTDAPRGTVTLSDNALEC